MKPGRDRYGGHRICETRTGTERTCWALTLKASPNQAPPMVNVQQC